MSTVPTGLLLFLSKSALAMFFPFHDNNPTKRWPIVTVSIIVINILSLAYVSGLSEIDARRLTAKFGFVPLRINQLTTNKDIQFDLYPDAEQRQKFGLPLPPRHQRRLTLKPVPTEILASLFTTMFLHAGIMHLAGNMWFFWLFGNNIEDRLGHTLFLCFYLLGGIAASFCHWAMTPEVAASVPVVGASGAVAVMLGAYGVTYPQAKIKVLVFMFVFLTVIELPALVVVGAWVFMQLLEGIGALHLGINGGVAWWAHIGGFLVGVFSMPLLAAGTPDPNVDWDKEVRQQFGPSPASTPPEFRKSAQDQWWEKHQ